LEGGEWLLNRLLGGGERGKESPSPFRTIIRKRKRKEKGSTLARDCGKGGGGTVTYGGGKEKKGKKKSRKRRGEKRKAGKRPKGETSSSSLI